MGKQNVNQKDFSEKVQILKSVFSEYRKATEELKQLPYSYKSPLFIKESEASYGIYEHQLLHKISKMNHYQEYIDFVDQKLLYLNETEKMIIEHDFICPSSKHWWELYFSSATYYRHRKKAVERLISLLFS